jgi:hypothetical protein
MSITIDPNMYTIEDVQDAAKIMANYLWFIDGIDRPTEEEFDHAANIEDWFNSLDSDHPIFNTTGKWESLLETSYQILKYDR